MALPGAFRLVLCAQLLSLLLIAVGARVAGAAEPRIVGGTTVPITSSPYQVRVLTFETLGTFQCGGSIRDATHVVTAAHCVVDEDAGSYPVVVGPGFVTVGYSDANQNSLTPVGVSTISVAPGYLRDFTSASDGAVLTLASPIDLAGDPDAEAIPFASDAEFNTAIGTPGTTAFATGWGVTSEGSTTTPALLRGVELRLQPHGLCEAEYGSEYDRSVMLCAGGDGASKDTCRGDSGGPLAIDATPETPPSAADRRLVGITSVGNGCGRPRAPGVYAWVQSPVLRPFLSAANPVGPPSAPATNPTIAGTLRVGQTLTCNAPQVPGGTPVRFLWYVVDGASFSRTAVTNVPTFQLPPELLGAFLICDVRYENAGGFSYSDTPATGNVGPVLAALATAPGGTIAPNPPPAVADTVRPKARVSSVRCLRGGRCTIKVSASDVGGRVRSLSARLSYRAKRCATVAGRRRCVSVKKTRVLRPARSGDGFTIVKRLVPNKYTVTVVATDTASNRSLPARKSFRVKRR